MQFAPPTIVSDASQDENSSGAQPADGEFDAGKDKSQSRLRRFFGRGK
jgi:hypothetical protein